MSERKLMIYPKNASRPIMLTDYDCEGSVEELKKSLENILEQDKIFAISTSDDLLLGRPSEVGFIQVQCKKAFKNFTISNKKQTEPVVQPVEDKTDELYEETINKMVNDHNTNPIVEEQPSESFNDIDNGEIDPYDELEITDD